LTGKYGNCCNLNQAAVGNFTFFLAGVIPFIVGTSLATLRRNSAGVPLM